MERQPLTAAVAPAVHVATQTVVHAAIQTGAPAKADRKTEGLGAMVVPATLVTADRKTVVPAAMVVAQEEVADREADREILATVAATVAADLAIVLAAEATITTVGGETTIAADRETITVATAWSNRSNLMTQN